MRKADSITKVARATGNQDYAVKAVLEAYMHFIQVALQSGEPVYINGIGKLTVVQRAARKGRDPNTGKIVEIPAHTGVKFKPSSTLMESLKISNDLI